jgi:hypothetical protein
MGTILKEGLDISSVRRSHYRYPAIDVTSPTTKKIISYQYKHLVKSSITTFLYYYNFFYYQLIIKSDIGRLVFSSERLELDFSTFSAFKKNNSTNRSLEKLYFRNEPFSWRHGLT